MGDDLRWRQCSVGDISLQAVPYFVFLDLILANADIYVIVKFKKLAVSPFVNLILGDFAAGIGFPQPLNTFVAVIGISG